MARTLMPNYVFTEHALFEMTRRGLTEEAVRGVLAAPEQQMRLRPGRMVLQSPIEMGYPGKLYLLRVFVDTQS